MGISTSNSITKEVNGGFTAIQMNTAKTKVDRSHYLFDNKMLVALIIPLIIEQLLAVLVGLADGIMIAQVGESAVSGVSLVDQVMTLLINLFAALATGGAVVAGQYLGMKRDEEANKSATQLIWFVTLCAIVITGIVYLGRNFILDTVFGEITPEVRAHANTYLMIVTASIPFIAMYNGGAAIFRAMGNSKVSMKVAVIMNIINVVGNAILVLGLKWGTEGVAIPTLVSRMVAAIMIMILLFNEELTLHVEKSWKYRPNFMQIKKILKVGIPNSVENSMFQLGRLMVFSLVSTFGTNAIAANAVSQTLAMVQILPGMAIGLAVTTVISRCVGAGDYEQVNYYNKKMLGIVYASMAATIALTYLALPWILKLYNLSDVTTKITTDIMLFHSIGAAVFWPISFTLPSTFRACGDARSCMIISILSMWIFRIGFSYVLGKFMGMGVFGIWVAMVIDWVFRCICFGIRYFRGTWKKQAFV